MVTPPFEFDVCPQKSSNKFGFHWPKDLQFFYKFFTDALPLLLNWLAHTILI